MAPEKSAANNQSSPDAKGSERPAEGESDFPTHRIDSAGVAGSIIGPYQLLEMIGEGGMGEVWLAEQKQPVRRRVAIKLIKAGMDTREVVARFESERQALALMDHPTIAKVFDAGSTLKGRPYFVMEYVAGLPITAYCDKRKLTTHQRMELFILVCEGVQHAHQKAIIHRDLKPSNILVTEVDGKPMPRIIDFGVAKATSQKLTAGTMYTRVGTLIGTLGYMSPEQANSAGEDIDTRSDVYSLGVVLYELLVGVLPLDFRKLAFDEVMRRLREQDVQKPSTRVRTLGSDSVIAAQNRHADPSVLSRQLHGDPDAITLKALEKDRAWRYASASELAADIGRYLRNEPVAAHAPSVGYRARKYVRRHRLGVSVAAAGVLLLIAFAMAQVVQVRRITRERDRANLITDFMSSMFTVSDPSEARGRSVTAREILDKASNGIDTGLSQDPELQAQMMSVMGNVYKSLGLYPQAEPLLERSADIRRRLLGPHDPLTLKSIADMAWVLNRENRGREAEKLQREVLEIRRRVLGPEHPDTIRLIIELANTIGDDGRLPEEEQLEREALAIQRRVLGPEKPPTLTTMNNLAGTIATEGRYADAEQLMRETLDIRRRVLGADHPATLMSMNNLAWTLEHEGHPADAEQLQRQVLDVQRRVLGPEHPETLRSMSNLASQIRKQGRYAEAETLMQETLDIRRRVLGPDHRSTVSTMRDIVDTYSVEGRFAAAEKLQRQIIDIRRRVLGPDHPYTASSFYDLACILVHENKNDEALALLREAVDHGLDAKTDLGLAKDADLHALQGDSRFGVLVEYARQRAAQRPGTLPEIK